MSSHHGLDESCLRECLLTRALSGLCVGMVFTDAAGRVVWLNHAAQLALGLNGEPVDGRPLAHLLKDLQLVAFWDEAGAAKGNHTAEVAVQYPESLTLKVSATHYTDEDGGAVGRALLICDVTADHRVRVELSEAVARRLLALTAGHMPPEPVGSLTHQEVRVLRLVGRGMGNEDIAIEAGIASSTVRSHLKNLYRKLGINSRAEAVSFAVRHNLV